MIIHVTCMQHAQKMSQIHACYMKHACRYKRNLYGHAPKSRHLTYAYAQDFVSGALKVMGPSSSELFATKKVVYVSPTVHVPN